jgi:RNA polymerase sigma factor (sigma-70 family)
MNDKATTEFADAQLLNRFRNGDNSAFDYIVDRYQKPLFTYLIRFVGDHQAAEDIFQDTFLKVLRGLNDYQEKSKFGNWLFGIAHHLAIDFLRKNRRYQKIFLDNEGNQDSDSYFENIAELNTLPDQNIEQKELKRILNNTINKLSEEQKEVFLLREHSDLTFKEIAELLNKPLNTVLAQMRYALLNLRKMLIKEYHGEISHVL